MPIDIVLAVFLLVGLFVGYNSGVIKALFSFVGFFLGAAVAVKFTGIASDWLYKTYALEGAWWPLAVFIAIIIIVILTVRLLALLLEKVLESVALGAVNKIAGAVVWCALMVFVYSLLLWFANEGSLIRPELKQASYTYEYLMPVGPWAIDALGSLIPWFKGMFAEISNLLDDLAKEVA